MDHQFSISAFTHQSASLLVSVINHQLAQQFVDQMNSIIYTNTGKSPFRIASCRFLLLL